MFSQLFFKNCSPSNMVFVNIIRFQVAVKHKLIVKMEKESNCIVLHLLQFKIYEFHWFLQTSVSKFLKIAWLIEITSLNGTIPKFDLQNIDLTKKKFPCEMQWMKPCSFEHPPWTIKKNHNPTGPLNLGFLLEPIKNRKKGHFWVF